MSLAADNLSFAYPGAQPLFEGLSLAVEPGERVALTAPSGAGKTTLCRLLSGYLEPLTGCVSVDGKAVSTKAPSAVPRSVQLIWQHPEQAFDPRQRMGAALREVPGANPAWRDELASRFGLRDAWMARFPHELSGGELMRFGIVRALSVQPRHLICDEMTAMLDAVTQAEVWHEVLAVADEHDMGLIVVSHSPALLDRVATRRILLSA